MAWQNVNTLRIDTYVLSELTNTFFVCLFFQNTDFNIIKKHKTRQQYDKTQQLGTKHTKNNGKSGPGQMGIKIPNK